MSDELSPKLERGCSQLSIVEHAWFPLNQELRNSTFTHTTSYDICRRNQPRVTGTVEVQCPDGMKPYDEYLLHGLPGLALAEPDPSNVFYATANHVMTWLGLDNGGKGYIELEESMTRLESALYRSKNFYNPIERLLSALPDAISRFCDRLALTDAQSPSFRLRSL